MANVPCFASTVGRLHEFYLWCGDPAFSEDLLPQNRNKLAIYSSQAPTIYTVTFRRKGKLLNKPKPHRLRFKDHATRKLPAWQDYDAVFNNATLNATLAPSGSVNGMHKTAIT